MNHYSYIIALKLLAIQYFKYHSPVWILSEISEFAISDVQHTHLPLAKIQSSSLIRLGQL